MTAKSFKQMIADKEIKRADAMKVQLEDLHEEPGFNLRDLDAVDPDGVSFQDGIDALAEYIAAGGVYPPLEVRPRAGGGVWLVDGHRRRLALLQLDAEGRLPRTPNKEDPKKLEAWVAVTAFDGNDAARVARIITSQQNRKLTDLEKANGCKRLAAFGWTPDQIAKAVGLTRSRVEQLMTLASANSDVHQMVKAGAISGTVAVDLVRKHGDGAGAVIAEELDKAKAQGKTKVTAGTMAPKALPRTIVDDLVAQVGKFSSRLTLQDRVTLDAFHKGDITEGTVTLDVETVLHLELCFDELKRIKADQELKAREKADKAKQLELENQ